MAEQILNTTLILRNDVRSNFDKVPTNVYAKGEPVVVFEADGSVRIYMGDGVTEFQNLVPTNLKLSDLPLASASVNGLLSKEDFTKLAGVAAGAQVNVIESIKVNNTALEVTDKGVNIVVPTGALASKDKVAESDLADALKEKVNAASDGNHSHPNKDVLDGITADEVAAWNKAQPNVIEAVKVNGVALTPADKAVDVTVPTGNLASKDTVAEADLDDALKTKINSTATDDAVDELTTRVAANETAIATLNGTGEGSVTKQIDDAFNDFSTKVTDDGVVNSYKELIDWAAAHGAEATELAKGISDNAAAIDALETLVGSKAVATQIAEAIDAVLKSDGVDKYALATDLTAAVARIAANETAIGGKVDKVDGKGLSTNDYTTEEKTKLAGIATGANKVEASTTNGNMKIDGAETTVYTLPNTVMHNTDTFVLNGGNA